MSKIILPPKYYLDHFREFTNFILAHYAHCLDVAEKDFLNDFAKLSEDAQCLYLRIANRKGECFEFASLQKYTEIFHHELAAAELRRARFVNAGEHLDPSQRLVAFSKAQLLTLARNFNLKPRHSESRNAIITLLKSRVPSNELASHGLVSNLIVQGRLAELDYLKFLFFGECQDNLILYTLRDLKIRRANTLNANYAPRFADRDEARAQYYYAQLHKRLNAAQKQDELNALAIEITAGPTPRNSCTEQMLEELWLDLGQCMIKVGDESSALEILRRCRRHPGTERYARLLFKLGKKEECRNQLEAYIETPSGEAELHFAEDYLLRKFNQKRTHILSDLLRQAPVLSLDESYRDNAERGVKKHFDRLGHRAFRSENYLWNALFGLVFWEELFESRTAAIGSPFERRPQSLIGGDFYRCSGTAIEAKLALLDAPKLANDQIMETYQNKLGTLNGIFNWHASLPAMLSALLAHSPPNALKFMLRTMAQNYDNCHSGFPDLMVVDTDGVRFVEVKAEGDQFRANQLQQFARLRSAGFQVELLRVEWHIDPAQTYVVVDVETTGSGGSAHRVTEIGAVKVRGGEIIGRYSTLLNPARPIPRFISQITGITDEMVRDAPSFDKIHQDFSEFLQDAVFVAHNVRFDYGFIQSEFARLDQDFVMRKFCTCLGARRAFPGLKSYSLKNLCAEFAVELKSHHRALCDAEAAAQILLHIHKKRGPRTGSANTSLEPTFLT